MILNVFLIEFEIFLMFLIDYSIIFLYDDIKLGGEHIVDNGTTRNHLIAS
jgi:hypothetical protein